MDPDKLEKLAQFAIEHAGNLLAIALPIVLGVATLIIWLYETFRVATVKETNARLRESNDRLEKEREALKEANKESNARLEGQIDRLEKERDALRDGIEQAKERNAEAMSALVAAAKQESVQKIQQLLSELSQFRISGKNEVSLSSFFADTPSILDGGSLVFNGKLTLPPLSANWIQVSHGDGSAGTFKGGDLGIFQRMTSVSWRSIERSLGRTLDFNEKHPPNIWTTDAVPDDEEDGWFLPYIQVSLISHTEAKLLMSSVREDLEEMGEKLESDLKEIFQRLQFEYHPREIGLETEEEATRPKWAVFLKRVEEGLKINTSEKLHRLIDALLPEGDRLTFSIPDNERLENIVKETAETIALYAKWPLLMLGNCVKSLSKMPPETGLLIGRLLYYVFGVAKGGKVDIQQLSSSYEGAYARIRTEADFSAHGKASSLVTNDYVLILATKSDFCLVHVHIPLHSKTEWVLDIEAQNWIKNIRMALLK